jgi:hypothetical protein
MSIRYERVKVTRSLATKLLGVNLEYNRRKKEAKIAQYAADMREGNWRDNGDTIRVTGTSLERLGKLIDGQNRLIAFLESGLKYMWFDFAFGVAEEAYPTINTGAARTFADVARSIDPENANVNGAIVRRIWMWERGRRLTGRGGGTAKLQPTHTQLLERLSQNVKEFHTATVRGTDGSQRKLGPASIVGTAFYLFYQVDQDQAHTFFEQVITGANLKEEAPALILRNRLLRDRKELTPDEMMILWCKAWNLFRKDETTSFITTFGFQGKPYTNDTFPEPK